MLKKSRREGVELAKIDCYGVWITDAWQIFCIASSHHLRTPPPEYTHTYRTPLLKDMIIIPGPYLARSACPLSREWYKFKKYWKRKSRNCCTKTVSDRSLPETLVNYNWKPFTVGSAAKVSWHLFEMTDISKFAIISTWSRRMYWPSDWEFPKKI